MWVILFFIVFFPWLAEALKNGGKVKDFVKPKNKGLTPF
jgi:hypothetical protein